MSGRGGTAGRPTQRVSHRAARRCDTVASLETSSFRGIRRTEARRPVASNARHGTAHHFVIIQLRMQPGAVPVSTRLVTFSSLNLGTQLTAL